MSTTAPPRPISETYDVGDVVTSDGHRWVIRETSPNGDVVLRVMNHPNVSIQWTTTVDKLPRKAAS